MFESQNMLTFQKEQSDFKNFLEVVFPSCDFCGRLQVGCRGKDKISIVPALTCDYDIIASMLEVFDFSPCADYYITGNSFSGIKRRKADLFSFHNLIIDLDCHQVFDWDEIDFQIDFIWRALCLFLESFLIPLPTMKVHTGRGLQLWWTFHGISGKFQPSYDFALGLLINFLNLFLQQQSVSFVSKFWSVDEGASRNVAGYFRLPSTMNTKVKRVVTYEKHGVISDLLVFCDILSKSVLLRDDLYGEDMRPELKEKADFVKSSMNISLASRFHKDQNLDEIFVRRRISFLEQIRDYRNAAVGVEERNNFCFMVYNTYVTVYGHEYALQWMSGFNSKFKKPLSSQELENVIVTAKKKGGYYYTNESMFSFLHVTEEEKTLFYPVSGRGAGKKQKALDVAKRREKRNDMILQLYQDGKTMVQVAEQLDITVQTVSTVLSPQLVKHSDQRRELILSLYGEGKKIAEIASLCTCSRRTVERVLAAARTGGFLEKR